MAYMKCSGGNDTIKNITIVTSAATGSNNAALRIVTFVNKTYDSITKKYNEIKSPTTYPTNECSVTYITSGTKWRLTLLRDCMLDGTAQSSGYSKEWAYSSNVTYVMF